MNMTTRPPRAALYFTAALSGALLALAYPTPGLWPLAFVGLVPVAVLTRGLPGKQVFWYGWLTGAVFLAGQLYWLAHVLTHFGHLPWLAALPILGLMIGYLSLFPGLTILGLNLAESRFGLKAGSVPWVLTGAVLFAGLEYFRGFFLTGFPWEPLGAALVSCPVLIQFADVAGAAGLTLIVAVINFSLAGAILRFRETGWKAAVVPAVFAALALAFLPAYGVVRQGQVREAMSRATSREFAVIQASIEQELKWDPKARRNNMLIYQDLTYQAALDRPWLIVWPETATPFFFLRDPDSTEWLLDIPTNSETALLFGSPAVELTPQGQDYYNRAYLVDGQGKVRGWYAKSHLVPYGEYVPLKRFFPFIKKLTQASGDFKPGEPGGVMELDGEKLGVLICYESIFSYLTLLSVNNGADYLVVMTNDAWFGRSSAPHQHFAQSVLRAVEVRRSLIRAANTGISGIILPDGRVLERLELFERDYLPGRAPRMEMKTVFAAVGNRPAQVMLAAAAVFLIAAYLRRRKDA